MSSHTYWYIDHIQLHINDPCTTSIQPTRLSPILYSTQMLLCYYFLNAENLINIGIKQCTRAHTSWTMRTCLACINCPQYTPAWHNAEHAWRACFQRNKMYTSWYTSSTHLTCTNVYQMCTFMKHKVHVCHVLYVSFLIHVLRVIFIRPRMQHAI